MGEINNKLNKWAINKIENEFDGKISLLLGRKGVGKVPTDDNSLIFDYYIPSCDEGYALSNTFIIDDIGYDLFPMSWERIEGLANLNEGILFCLADSEILYARSEEDKKRFEDLRILFFNNLNNNKLIYIKSLQRINSAKEIYTNMLFEDDMCNIRKGAGAILQYLCEAIAMINKTYLKGDYGYSGRIKQIESLKIIPNDFIEIYNDILKSNTKKEIVQLVYNIIYTTRQLFNKINTESNDKNYNYNDLAGWYEESRYTFRRIEYACDNNDYESCYNWGCYLQIEFDILTEESSLKKMDLLSSYRYDDLSYFKKCAKDIEKYILSEIEKHKVKLNKYNNVEDFLENQKQD